MKKYIVATTAVLAFATSVAYADEPSPPPASDQPARTHIDTTVVGDAVVDGSGPKSIGLESSVHDFQPGAPELVSATKRLNLSPHQEAQVRDAIERADAGAAVLIKHEQDLAQMVAATTPQDPLYATLIRDQAASAARWNANRDALRQEVLSVLTEQQRVKFEELMAKR